MSLTLKDLRVVYDYPTSGRRHEHRERLASLADLVEVLKQEKGAWIVEAPAIENIGTKEILLKRPGRYLILPLEDTPDQNILIGFIDVRDDGTPTTAKATPKGTPHDRP